MSWIVARGIVTQGHGVASGQARNPRFPQGTLKLQKPLFKAQGFSLEGYFLGTINLSISPRRYRVKQPKATFKNVDWSSDSPPEDFSFFDCRVLLDAGKKQPGLIYYPHPETKPEHFQSPDILEVLTDFIQDLSYGDELTLEINGEQMEII